MNRSLASLAAAVTLAPLFGAAQQAGVSAAISGLVVDATTGQPVGGATVSLGRLDGGTIPTPPRVVTDSRGRFVYAGLEPGNDYYLGARGAGYEYTRYGWTAPGQTLAINDIHRITLAAGQWVSDVKIPLWRLPVIGGRVVDERGEPVVGVAIRAFSQQSIAGHRQLVGSSIVTTDDRGVYRLTDLAPGDYVVAVLSVQSTVLASTPEGRILRAVGELQTGGIGAGGPAAIAGPGLDLDGRHRLAVTNFATPPPPSSTQPRAYPAQFYPGASTFGDATMLELSYRETQLGIDFQLRPVPAVRVSGRIEGPPSPGMLLRLLPAGSEGLGFGSEAATTILSEDGGFTFFNVPAGQYTLIAQSAVMDFTTGSPSARLPTTPGYPAGGAGVGSRNGTPGLSYLSYYGSRAPSWGRMPIAVGNSDLDGVVLAMHPVGKVSGRIVPAEGVTIPPNARIRVSAEPANGDPSLGLASGTVRLEKGVFTFTVEGLLGGTYLIAAEGGFTTASVVTGGRDVTSTGVDAAAAPEINDVVITVTDKRQEIRGTVSGAPGRTAGVIAFPVDPALWANFGWDAHRFRTTRAGSSGTFTVRPYAAGEYFLIAIDATKLDSWTDPKFLAAAAPLATRVVLAWGETKTQDLVWRDVGVK